MSTYMESDRSEWTTADFDRLSWHDCHVYGFGLEPGVHGTAQLTFDIDFIVEWLCTAGRCEFRIAPATLTFHEAFGLRVELDYARVSAGTVPFSLDGIERERTGETVRWRLPINWPSGSISFESSGFTQRLRRPAVVVDRQHLLPHERG